MFRLLLQNLSNSRRSRGIIAAFSSLNPAAHEINRRSVKFLKAETEAFKAEVLQMVLRSNWDWMEHEFMDYSPGRGQVASHSMIYRAC